MEDLISVIVPVYNVEDYLNKSVQSIISQTYKNLEIILVDDGSIDRSGEMCDEFAKSDNRINVIHKTNGGQGSARNCALEICTGKYILFLDSDDFLELDCVERLYRVIRENNVDIAVCNYRLVDEKGMANSTFSELEGYYEFDGYEVLKHMWNDEIINIAPWAKLYRKELWDKLRFKECYCEDSATMYLLYNEKMRIGYIGDCLVNYLLRSTSDVRSFSSKKLIMLDIYEVVVKYAEEYLPQNLQRAAISKAVSVNFHVLFQFPRAYSAEEKKIHGTIKKYRKTVLCDREARLKTRLACLISVFGFGLTKWIFKLMKKNNPAF